MANNGNNQQRNGDEISFKILEHITVLGTKDNGWNKEANIVAWNGGKGKVDVREWDPTHVRMSRGITLFEEEAEKLTRALAERYGIGAPGPLDAGISDDEGLPSDPAAFHAAAETASSSASQMAQA